MRMMGLFSLSIPADVTDPIINVPYSLIAKDKNGLVSRGWPELTTTETSEENNHNEESLFNFVCFACFVVKSFTSGMNNHYVYRIRETFFLTAKGTKGREKY